MSKVHLLLVEDNDSDAELIKIWLRSIVHFSHEIEVATRLSEARQCLQEKSFDVVLLDLGLPDSDMPNTLSQIPSLSEHCPIVVMTGLEDEEVGIQAVQQGAQDYLVKQSINGDMLVRVMRYAIARRNAEEAQKTNSALQKALAHERELNELKSRFINIVSHEFRTPLSVIMVSTDTLRKYNHRISDEQRMEKLRRIKHSVQHLTTLIENVLLFGQSNSNTLHLNLEKIDIDNLINDVIDQFRELPTTHQNLVYTLHPDCPSEIVADKDLIRNILSNLISNACKYSPDGTTVDIKLEGDDEEITLIIKDAGIGIPEEDLKQLFTPFHRASNVQTTQGTGIGLVTVKEIATAHGGRIDVQSKINEGTTFTITLPTNQLENQL